MYRPPRLGGEHFPSTVGVSNGDGTSPPPVHPNTLTGCSAPAGPPGDHRESSQYRDASYMRAHRRLGRQRGRGDDGNIKAAAAIGVSSGNISSPPRLAVPHRICQPKVSWWVEARTVCFSGDTLPFQSNQCPLLSSSYMSIGQSFALRTQLRSEAAILEAGLAGAGAKTFLETMNVPAGTPYRGSAAGKRQQGGNSRVRLSWWVEARTVCFAGETSPFQSNQCPSLSSSSSSYH